MQNQFLSAATMCSTTQRPGGQVGGGGGERLEQFSARASNRFVEGVAVASVFSSKAGPSAAAAARKGGAKSTARPGEQREVSKSTRLTRLSEARTAPAMVTRQGIGKGLGAFRPLFVSPAPSRTARPSAARLRRGSSACWGLGRLCENLEVVCACERTGSRTCESAKLHSSPVSGSWNLLL